MKYEYFTVYEIFKYIIWNNEISIIIFLIYILIKLMVINDNIAINGYTYFYNYYLTT